MVFNLKKYLMGLIVLIVGLSIAMPTSASDNKGKEGQGVFSQELLNGINSVKNQIEHADKSLSDEKVYEKLRKEIQKAIEKEERKTKEDSDFSTLGYDEWGLGSLVGNNLGPTEQQVCNSNSWLCSYVLADAAEAADDTEDQFSSGLHNGIADAYRHGYWQARSAFHTGSDYAKRFGDAHETDFYSTYDEYLMDNYNNRIGRGIGVNQTFVWQVNNAVMDGIDNGDFLYLGSNGILTETY